MVINIIISAALIFVCSFQTNVYLFMGFLGSHTHTHTHAHTHTQTHTHTHTHTHTQTHTHTHTHLAFTEKR
jgi:ABC-type nickel/cobalt efflux system permease component RcnA